MRTALPLLLALAMGLPAADQTYTTTTPHSRIAEGWYAARHEKLSLAAQEHPGLMFIGDSITELWAEPDRGKGEWDARYAPLGALNLGFSADRTQDVLWRLQNGEFPEGCRPKAVVLLTGTNNIYENSGEEVAKGVAAIIAEIQRRSPDTRILLLGVLPRGEQADHGDRKKVAAMNAHIATVADGRRVVYLDIGDRFLSPDGSISNTMMTDFIHPSQAGYTVFAQAIDGQLRKLLN